MTPKLKITAQSTPEQLPDNIATLKQMVLTLLAQIDDVNGQLYYLKRQLFGKKSEKLDPNQRLLFEDMYNELQAQVDAKEEEEDKTDIKKKKKKKNANHQGRKPLPKDLPRETIVIEPDAEELVCPDCHCAKEHIGSEVSERLEFAMRIAVRKAWIETTHSQQLPHTLCSRLFAGFGSVDIHRL